MRFHMVHMLRKFLETVPTASMLGKNCAVRLAVASNVVQTYITSNKYCVIYSLLR